jgi:hypothetical protein
MVIRRGLKSGLCNIVSQSENVINPIQMDMAVPTKLNAASFLIICVNSLSEYHPGL